MAPADQDLELLCHEITSKEESPETLRKLLTLSVSIFDPETPESEIPTQNRLCTWEDRISLPGSVIHYVTNSSLQLLGFVFALPRTQPEIDQELLHIWLAGVDPSSRGLGVFPLLVQKVKQHAQLHRYPAITVCTYPRRFEKMYRILGKNGWEVVAWPIENEKVLMKMSV